MIISFFWGRNDLEKKLEGFQQYYNHERCHSGIDGISPEQKSKEQAAKILSLKDYRWKNHCRGLFQLPMAA